MPPSRIGVNGIDDDNSDIIFAFAYNSQTIAVKDKEYLKQGDSVTVEYVGMFPIPVSYTHLDVYKRQVQAQDTTTWRPMQL